MIHRARAVGIVVVAAQLWAGAALPATWSGRAAGGGGMKGFVPNLTGGGPGGAPPLLAHDFATYGSDSGHKAPFGPPGGRPATPPGAREGANAGPRPGAASGPAPSDDWAVDEEAIANLGYMEMKKTRDAAMVIVERVYGQRPRVTYFIGGSQGGREALTVAQRYPADYDGISAGVPIVSFSTLMLAPELIPIQEKPIADWVTPAKVNAIRGEFMRQCGGLDGLDDGIVNNYMACRAIFDVTRGAPNRRPWAAKRCPNACLTDGQISTLELTYSRYRFATPLAHGTRSFGMWLPNTDPGGSGLIAGTRFKGQERAAEDAPRQLGLLFDWVEKGIAPGVSVTVTAGDRSLPLCSYPSYPHFRGGEPGELVHVLTPTISPSFRVGGLTCT